MSRSALDPSQVQQQAQVLEDSAAWSELLDYAQRQRPHCDDQPQLSGYLDYLTGRALVELEQSEQAEIALRRACTALPEFPYAFQLLGRSFAIQKQWAAAAAAQERCIALKEDFGYAWMELGRARDALGATAAALQAYRQADKLLPGDDWLECRLIHLQVKEALEGGDHKLAASRIVALQQQRSLPPSQLLTWLEAAAALARCGRWPEAIQLAAAIRSGGEKAGRPSPLGTRAPLLLLSLAVLMAPKTSAQIQPQALAGTLLETLWLPNEPKEDAFWHRTLVELLSTVSQVLTSGWPQHNRGQVALVLALVQVTSERFNDHERALALLEQLAVLPELTDGERRLLDERCGLMALAAKRPLQAGRHLLRVPEAQRSPSVQAALNGAQLSLAGRHLPLDLRQGQTTALQLLREFAQRPRSSQIRADLNQLLWKLNKRVIDDTNAMAHASGPISTAQELRRRGLNLISALTTQSLNPPGLAPMPTHWRPARRWLLVANASLPQCFLYRVEQKKEQLESLDREVRIIDVEDCNSWSIASALLWADRVVVCRLPGTYPVLRTMSLARRMGLTVYYDIDDLIFDQEHFPPPLPSYGGTISAELHTGLAMDAPLFEAAMAEADALVFSTTTLATRWGQLHPKGQQPVHVLANMAPPALRREAKTIQPQLHQAVADGHLRLLVSSGTLAHKQVWVDELAPALAEILEKHPQVQLDLVGSIEWPQEQRTVASGRIRSLPFSDYPTYLRHVGRAHIGLAPLEPGIVTDAKSAIKWMEYSLMGLASVVSPTATYKDILKEGSEVLFAADRQGWVRALERLIRDRQLRTQLAIKAQEQAEALFGPRQGQRFWQELDTANHQAQSPSHRRKQLVINCFFAPQSVGGATRVAQNRVRELLDQADAPDVTVLCVDLDPWQGGQRSVQELMNVAEDKTPDLHQANKGHELLQLLPQAMALGLGEKLINLTNDQKTTRSNTENGRSQGQGGNLPLDVHHWHGARVVRLSVTNKPWDWHHDGDVERFCRDWFEREGFDAIEAHSMQILTAAPLRVAKEMGIPYTVVIHDAWWLSQLQFLTRDDGTAVDPIDPLAAIDSSAHPAVKEAAHERRRDLFKLLEGAQERLAVSDTFAELHRRAGVRDMGVRTNTVARPEGEEIRQHCQRNSGEPIRICMVGGMAVHKGYAIFRAAVQQAGLGHKARITVIDHRLDEGDPSYSLQWGGSPVQFCASIPMTRMNHFYGSQDVLVAPSIWPESFGLVTREALQLGLWVIASDIGALAEPIDDGVNGRKVVPRCVPTLTKALREIIDNPQLLKA